MAERSKRARDVIAKAMRLEELYGNKPKREYKNPHKPRWKVRPTGNPLRGKVGVKASIDF